MNEVSDVDCGEFGCGCCVLIVWGVVGVFGGVCEDWGEDDVRRVG